MSVTISGHSDDLIEVEGDIREEFGIDYDSHGELFAFSDGTIIQVQYSKVGVWRITPMVKGSGELTIVQAPVDDDSNYTDRATLDADIRWVLRGTNLVTKR